MLTRRHIRVKVMQSIYALVQSKDDSLQRQEKFLKVSIENTYTLYLLWLSLFVEIQKRAAEQISLSAKKYISDGKQEFPNPKKFVQNRLLVQILENKTLEEEISNRKLDNWYLNEEYVKLIYKDIIESETYKEYMSTPESDYAADKELILTLFKNIIAPNEKIYDYFEDDKLTWVDDIPIVNTFLLKHLKKVKQVHPDSYFLPSLLKDDEDMTYAMQLLSRTLLKNDALEKEIDGKTPNWDKDRIAGIDSILLKMAICELLHFPSIPERVTINEYLEIAKEYSTPKSSIFINGILDKLTKEYKSEGKLNKMGRGLL
ncbi:MAG: transcription antitermination factor NusB [Maribacter dokdonensis]|uniref:N utilization substance protein B n=2 Tax=Flavobacteriaceae TaxID=49546 RepID=A0ABY0UM30_9FLAO|nr:MULTISPECIES: transcription antitermination factor NusB [Maribacter]HAF79213.1 transcription antitermination factor NusB [Maribacter sp.]APA65203.1 antitermination protein NusB [Maribacter sp. 1_2014MBL_MicDiv]MBU2899729.1 transcription antitermination factor NusB [Maribacter dokdonensis]PHN93964.1 transcription antitermination factor NusB [Maribacter sp. 6B07]CAG2532242.1 NusB antitermination factor [Maribacter dokdonensis]|tara:strand:+ start:605 stop:1552 length:948 start_codon:yes stop_codon:yes gene_type:complete